VIALCKGCYTHGLTHLTHMNPLFLMYVSHLHLQRPFSTWLSNCTFFEGMLHAWHEFWDIRSPSPRHERAIFIHMDILYTRHVSKSKTFPSFGTFLKVFCSLKGGNFIWGTSWGHWGLFWDKSMMWRSPMWLSTFLGLFHTCPLMWMHFMVTLWPLLQKFDEAFHFRAIF